MDFSHKDLSFSFYWVISSNWLHVDKLRHFNRTCFIVLKKWLKLVYSFKYRLFIHNPHMYINFFLNLFFYLLVVFCFKLTKNGLVLFNGGIPVHITCLFLRTKLPKFYYYSHRMREVLSGQSWLWNRMITWPCLVYRIIVENSNWWKRLTWFSSIIIPFFFKFCSIIFKFVHSNLFKLFIVNFDPIKVFLWCTYYVA